MTKPVWSHVLALSAWTLKKSLIISYQETRQIYHQQAFTFQTIPDCTRYIIGVFWYNFKSQMNILASY